jgi:hypothetical protein
MIRLRSRRRTVGSGSLRDAGAAASKQRLSVMPKNVAKSRDRGGRDRDRTCDPYHVKVVSMAECAENQALSESLSSKGGMMFDGCSRFGVWRTNGHYISSLDPEPPIGKAAFSNAGVTDFERRQMAPARNESMMAGR